MENLATNTMELPRWQLELGPGKAHVNRISSSPKVQDEINSWEKQVEREATTIMAEMWATHFKWEE